MVLTLPQEFFIWDVICMIWLYALDMILTQIQFLQKGGERARWFCMHTIGNAMIAIGSARDTAHCIMDHSISNVAPDWMMPASMAFGMHLYHCMAFRLRPEDWSHHILFVFGVTPLLLWYPTKATSVCLFFCTGVPGMLDYGILTLVKTGNIQRRIQKRVAGLINAYMRMPGGALGGSLLIQDGLKDQSHGTCGLILGGMMLANSCFYGHQAIYNAGRYDSKKT